MFSKLKKLFARCEHQYYFAYQEEKTNTRKNEGKYWYNFKSNGNGLLNVSYQMHTYTYVVYKRCKKCNFKKEEAEFFGNGATAEARNLAEELNKFVN